MDSDYLRRIILTIISVAIFVIAMFMSMRLLHITVNSKEYLDEKIEKYINEEPSSTVTIPKEDVVVTFTPND